MSVVDIDTPIYMFIKRNYFITSNVVTRNFMIFALIEKETILLDGEDRIVLIKTNDFNTEKYGREFDYFGK